MIPYYEDSSVTIYHGDCREIMPTLTADAVITDPPYGLNLRAKQTRNPGRSGSHKVNEASTTYDDDPAVIRALIAEVMPLVFAVADRALIFPGSAMLYAYPEPAALGTVFNPAGSGYSSWGFQCSQPILYYGKYPSLQDGNGHHPNGFIDRWSADTGGIDHPCPKPLHWMTWAIAKASREGETILDPFVGSGTTLVAAKKMGRKAIGIELSERYCEIAAGRLNQQVLDFA